MRWKLDKKVAMTLFEVLITLGIIGVVCAMTIPTLIKNYQKAQTISQLKEAYSILNQAVALMQADNGGTLVGLFSSNAYNYGANYNLDVFAQYLKPARLCYGESDTFNNCWVYTYNFEGTIKTGPSKDYTQVASGMVLNNGMSILLTGTRGDLWGPALGAGTGGSTCTGGGGTIKNECSGVTIDLNGAKPPNRDGYDVFLFVVTKNGLQPFHDSWTDCNDSGGSGASFHGSGCAYRIINQDNWEINYY